MNVPEVKLGIVAVSRDCFPKFLSERRRAAVVKAYHEAGGAAFECSVCVETETDAMNALSELQSAGCNALCVYLGNFGPEGPTSQLIRGFSGPCMVLAASEEPENDLIEERGDAFCGLLNLCYNLKLRAARVYLPEYPVGTAEQCAGMIEQFVPVARAILGLAHLKIITFGPRPSDFFACNSPIKALFDLGVEIEENSELDLLAAYQAHAADSRIAEVVRNMQQELGEGNTQPALLPRLAQYELTLRDWAKMHLGASRYIAFANKCWPAFQTQFRFVPCYVNGRMTADGIPVACETDIYGALSEYLGTALTGQPVTLLDINNTVPEKLYRTQIAGSYNYRQRELFMGFHCGNASVACLESCNMCNQRIMARKLGNEVTFGTLEGMLKSGDVTLFRLHANPDATLQAYAAQGEILKISERSFGSRGVIAVSEMDRFYRHVLLEKGYPHHCAVLFGHYGQQLCSTLKLLGLTDGQISVPYSAEERYPGEYFLENRNKTAEGR